MVTGRGAFAGAIVLLAVLLAGCDFGNDSPGPRCDGDTVVVTVDGEEIRTDCGDGKFCNAGLCVDTGVDFPDDSGFHTDRCEWWYYTGHLQGGGTEYGYEVTIFQYDYEVFFGTPGVGYMCHVAVLDATAGEHYHYDTFALSSTEWTNDPFVLEVDNCRFEMDGFGNDHVIGIIPEGGEKDGKASPWVIDLTLEPQKRATRHGGDGFIPMADTGGTSYYYSYTRMGATGTISTPDGDVEVAGQGWMDHQWGDFDMVDFKGWDWWSMQFDDGREIMLFQFTDWDDVLCEQAGTIVEADGTAIELAGMDDFLITPLRKWTSPWTLGEYPLDWDITIPKGNFNLQVRTHVDDQEMYNIAQNYWEGATTVTGTSDEGAVTGVGYTELTGYAKDDLDPVR